MPPVWVRTATRLLGDWQLRQPDLPNAAARRETSNVLAYLHVANDPSDMEQVANEDELRLWEFLSDLPSLTPQCLQDAERGALSQMTHVRMRIYDCIIDNKTSFGLVEESTFSKKKPQRLSERSERGSERYIYSLQCTLPEQRTFQLR